MKRRQLLEVLLAAGLCCRSVQAGRLPQAETARKSYDVIVVGSGAAGLSAAVSAAEHGARRVLVLEKAPTLGGHTIVSTGYVSAINREKLSASEIDAACEAMLAGVGRLLADMKPRDR